MSCFSASPQSGRAVSQCQRGRVLGPLPAVAAAGACPTLLQRRSVWDPGRGPSGPWGQCSKEMDSRRPTAHSHLRVCALDPSMDWGTSPWVFRTAYCTVPRRPSQERPLGPRLDPRTHGPRLIISLPPPASVSLFPFPPPSLPCTLLSGSNITVSAPLGTPLPVCFLSLLPPYF